MNSFALAAMLTKSVHEDFSSALSGIPVQQILAYAPVALLVLLLILGIQGLRSLVTRSVSEKHQRYRIRKVITYGGALLVLVLLFSTISSRMTQLSIVIGALGAATVFALQEVIASLAGWIALSFGGFYKPGDRVELGGIKGDVIDIGLLRTTLMEIGAWVDGDLYSGRIVRIANSYVFKEPVFNYSTEFPFVWDEIKLPLRYGSDLDLAERLILEAVNDRVESYTEHSKSGWKAITMRFLIEDAQLEPAVTFSANDNWIECTVRYIVSYKLRRSTMSAITRTILAAFERTEGKIRIASTTLELVASPDPKPEPQN